MMGSIDPHLVGEGLNRLVKLALDSGEATTLAEALATFAGYRLHIVAGEAIRTPAGQAALLTAINAGRRSFLGGVTVAGELDVSLLVPHPGTTSLSTAARALGAEIGPAAASTDPQIHLGGCPSGQPAWAVRAVMSGWAGGCVPVSGPLRIGDDCAHVLAGIVAGSLAVSEAFQHVRGSNAAAGRRSIGISLWRPDLDWLAPEAKGPAHVDLPASAWLIGLGNLGQAFLWAFGMLPFSRPEEVVLGLQDFDQIAESNDSTSLLTDLSLLGQGKTRAMAGWADRRGFRTFIVERRFAGDFRVAAAEPPVAFCGVDNALARRALEDVGFARIIEAGLGKGVSDYLAMRLHTFPARTTARETWPERPAEAQALLDKPAYRDLADAGADICGLTRLAGRSVGAPFVGAIAGALAVAELIRLANGGPGFEVVDLHMRSPAHHTCVAQRADFAFNPGLAASAAANC